jgi:hypothetical protein
VSSSTKGSKSKKKKKLSNVSALGHEDFCAFLDLTEFKVYPCKADSNAHNLKRCPYYHDQKKD